MQRKSSLISSIVGAACFVCTMYSGFLPQDLYSADEKPAVTLPQGRPRIPLTNEKSEGWSYQFTKSIKELPTGKWTAFKPHPNLGMTIPNDMTCAWMTKNIQIPSEWQGRNVAINITWLRLGTKIFVNGKEAGEILGYGGDLDITDLVHFGKENTLLLAFPKRDSEQLDTIDKFTHAIAVSSRGGRNENLYNVGVSCNGDEFYLESRPAEAFVEDVWYQPFVRGYQRVNALTTINAAKPISGLKAKLTIYDAATGAVVRDAVYPLKKLNTGNNEVSLPMEALGLKQWDIRQPNLYCGQVALLDASGKEIDKTHPVKFGIREFWAQGRVMMLNNHPVNFVIDTTYMKYKNVEEMFAAGVTLMENTSVIMAFSLDNQTENADRCDKLGMGYMAAGVIANSMFDSASPDIKDAAVMSGYRTWVQNHTRRLRNHPSILFWGLTACCGGGYTDFRWDILGRASGMGWQFTDVNTAHLTHREIDPTRLTFVHGGPLVGDVSTGLIYFNHLPTQEVEDWLNDWSEKGDRPIIATEFSGNQLDVDYTKGPYSFITEYAAILAGDKAYEQATDDIVRYETIDWPIDCKKSIWIYNPYKYSPLVVQQVIDSQNRVLRTWRQRGVATVNWLFKAHASDPKFTSNATLFESYLKLIKPSYAWLGGPEKDITAKDHSFYSGAQIEKSVLLMRDLAGNEQWETTWTVKQAGSGNVIASGKNEETVAAFARMAVPVKFKAPEVKEPTKYTIEFKTISLASKEEIGSGSFNFTVHPKMTPVESAANGGSSWFSGSGKDASPYKDWAILDPEGDTTAWLKGIGVEVTPFADAKQPLKVLLIGRRALRSIETLPFTAKDLENGLQVVIFEQNCDDLAPLGFRMEDRAPRQVFMRIADYPALKGITTDDLRDWRGNATLFTPGPERDQAVSSSHFYRCGNKGVVASAIMETPQFGPFWPAIDCEFDLAYSPLLYLRHGKGMVTFCTLDLTGRVGSDPAATTIARNMMEQLGKTGAQAQQSKTVLGLSAKSVERLKALGFSAEMLPAMCDPKTQIVAIESADRETLAAKRPLIAGFVKDGGDVIVFNADSALLGDELFGGRVAAKETVCSRAARTVEKNPLLSGVGPQNVHWREPIKLNVLESTDKGFTSLLGGYAGTLEMGKGRIVFIQPTAEAMNDLSAVKSLPPVEVKKGEKAPAPLDDKFHKDNRKRSLWNVNRLNSQILANLGARGSEELVNRILNVRRAIQYTPVNRWMYLGLFPPPSQDQKVDPLDQYYTQYLAKRDISAKMKNARGQTIEWQTPTDFNNGIGIDGKMELSKRYPRQLMDSAIAVTQVWSTKAREATIYFGADWWIKVIVNGETIFWTAKEKGWNHGHDFSMTRKIKLKEGWNDIVCIVASGSQNHAFWFKISDPGDLRVEQKITTPTRKPANLPPLDKLADEHAPAGFSLYTEPPPAGQDPFQFIPW